MCLIVAKNSKEASFSVQDFRASFARNGDGTGIMYVENGRVVVEKTMGTVRDHVELYYKHMHRPQFVLHHRMATHGEKSLLNVHPFKVLSLDEGDPYDLYMVHNGVISMNKFSTDCDKRLSDTHLFANEYLTPLMRKYPTIIEDKVFQIMLSDYIGSSNKLTFLRNDGYMYIFNKSSGDDHNGCWLSNKYSIAGAHTTKFYGKTHGASYDKVGYGNYGQEATDEDNAPYTEENGVWRRDWTKANTIKDRATDSLTSLTVNELLESIEQYAGMPEKTFEDLFVSDPHLVYDMINLLNIEPVNESILNEKASVVAAKLYELLQGYAKKKAA